MTLVVPQTVVGGSNVEARGSHVGATELVRGREEAVRRMVATLLPRGSRTREVLSRDPLTNFGMSWVNLTGMRDTFQFTPEVASQIRPWQQPEGDFSADVRPGTFFAVNGVFVVDNQDGVTLVSTNEQGDSSYFLLGNANPDLARFLADHAGIEMAVVVQAGNSVWATEGNQGPTYYGRLGEFGILPPVNISHKLLEQSPVGMTVGFAGQVSVDGEDIILVSGMADFMAQDRTISWPVTNPLKYEDGTEVAIRDHVTGTGTIIESRSFSLSNMGRKVRSVQPPETVVKVGGRKKAPVRDLVAEYDSILQFLKSNRADTETSQTARRKFATLWHTALQIEEPYLRHKALDFLFSSTADFPEAERPFVVDYKIPGAQKDAATIARETHFVVWEHTPAEVLQQARTIFYAPHAHADELRQATLRLVGHVFGPEAVVSVLEEGVAGRIEALTSHKTDIIGPMGNARELLRLVEGLGRSSSGNAASLLFHVAEFVIHPDNDNVTALHQMRLPAIDSFLTVFAQNPEEMVGFLEKVSYGKSAASPQQELRRKQEAIRYWQWQQRLDPASARCQGLDTVLKWIDYRISVLDSQSRPMRDGSFVASADAGEPVFPGASSTTYRAGQVVDATRLPVMGQPVADGSFPSIR